MNWNQDIDQDVEVRAESKTDGTKDRVLWIHVTCAP